MIQIAFTLNCMIFGLMTVFLKFHIELASDNKTTIENLDKKGQPFVSIYNIGATNNWQQIFGVNKWLWPFPVFCGSGKPMGDGIYWPSRKEKNNRRDSESTSSETKENQDNRMDYQKLKEDSLPQDNQPM